jgi:hypothetical protein
MSGPCSTRSCQDVQSREIGTQHRDRFLFCWQVMCLAGEKQSRKASLKEANAVVKVYANVVRSQDTQIETRVWGGKVGLGL